jgi:hypothetical protein
MRRFISLTWRRRFITAAFLGLITASVLVFGVAKSPAPASAATATTDSCGYPIANTAAFPRGATTFSESTVLKGFSPTTGGILGDKIIAYYSDEHALTIGGVGADWSSTQATAPPGSTGKNSLTNTSPVFGAQSKDPNGRPLQPILYVTAITAGGGAKTPASGDWQAVGQVGNEFTKGYSPDALYGTYKPSPTSTFKNDPPKNNTNDGPDAPTTWPAGFQNEGYTTQIVWNTTSLNLQSGHVYKLQFMDHDGDQNNTGGDTGEGCTTVSVPALTTTATDASVGDANGIHDTAHVSGLPAGTTGSVKFQLFSDSLCATQVGSDTFNNNVNGSGDYVSANVTGLNAGTYYWKAALYRGASGTGLLLAGSACGDAGETSHITPKSPTLTTNAGTTKLFVPGGPNSLTDSGTLSGGFNPTGTITFTLYGPGDATCAGAEVGHDTVTVTGNSPPDYSGTVAITAPGLYRWIANYSGDASGNNNPTTNTCNGTNENVKVINPTIQVLKNPKKQTVVSGGTVTFHIIVTNTSVVSGGLTAADLTLTNVAVTDHLLSNVTGHVTQCERTAAQIAADPNAPHPGTATFAPQDTYSYDCSISSVTADDTNIAEACGTSIINTQVCDNDNNTIGPRSAPFGLEHMSSAQDFKPKDSASITLTGTGDPLNGKVTFQLFKGSCDSLALGTGNLIYSDTQNASGFGTYSTVSNDFLSTLVQTARATAPGSPIAAGTSGTYNWRITYSKTGAIGGGADTNGNGEIDGACGTENFVVTNGVDFP